MSCCVRGSSSLTSMAIHESCRLNLCVSETDSDNVSDSRAIITLTVTGSAVLPQSQSDTVTYDDLHSQIESFLVNIIGVYSLPCRAYTPLVTSQNVVKKIKIMCNLATLFWPYHLEMSNLYGGKYVLLFSLSFVIIVGILNFGLRNKEKC